MYMKTTKAETIDSQSGIRIASVDAAKASIKSKPALEHFMRTAMAPHLEENDVVLLPQGAIDRDALDVSNYPSVDNPRSFFTRFHYHARISLVTSLENPVETLIADRKRIAQGVLDVLSTSEGVTTLLEACRYDHADEVIETVLSRLESGISEKTDPELDEILNDHGALLNPVCIQDENASRDHLRLIQKALVGNCFPISWADNDAAIVNFKVMHARSTLLQQKRNLSNGLHRVSW